MATSRAALTTTLADERALARRGILLALGSFAVFTAMDTSIKLLSDRYATLQIMAINAAIAAAIAAVVALRRGGRAQLRTTRPGMHLMRGCLSVVGAWLGFHAYARLPLADVYAIFFAMPLIISALSVPLLGERVGWHRWAAIVTGFAGVFVMLWPSGEAIQLAALGAVVAAFINAFVTILVRVVRGDPPETFAVYGNLTVAILTGATLPFVWVTPTLPDWLLLVFCGSCCGTGFLLLVAAYRMAPAAVIAPFQYSQMLYALVIGAVLFGSWPDARMLLGAAIVVLSGLYVLHREALRRSA